VKDEVPVKEIVIVPETYEEAVDVTGSSAMKKPHQRFGEWMKKLAAHIKPFYERKGNWQALWTIATRVFGLCYHGHDISVARALARSLALTMDVPQDVADGIVDTVYRNFSDIIGEKRARGAPPE